MEAMNLVEVVLNNEHEGEEESCQPINSKSSPIKGLDESVTITVTRTPGRPISKDSGEKRTGKPASFALMSNMRNGVKKQESPRARLVQREELVCKACDRVFKYKAAFLRHEAQCGLPVALKVDRNAFIEAKKAEKAAAEAERRKLEEKLPELRCPTCLKQFHDQITFKNHDFQGCAAERATYTFVCGVCQARFKYKNHMRRHEDSHNNVRRFNCDVCTTAFLRPDHLKRHMMRMHGIVQMPMQIQTPPGKSRKKPSPLPCAVQSSDEQNNYAITKTAPMQCPLCSKILSRRDHVLRHMRNVHHMNFDGGRRRGRVSMCMGQTGGFEIDGNMKADGSRSVCEDDESESQSMTSHDGLRIDESYEDVKQECESPVPDEASDMMHDDNGSSPDMQERDYSEKKHIKSEPVSGTEDTEDHSSSRKMYLGDGVEVRRIKAEPESEIESCRQLGNFSGLTKKILEEVTSRPASAGKSISSQNRAQEGVRGTSEFKTVQKGSSDGNQNVLNGHVSRGAGEDWISDLVNFSGW